MNTTLSPEIKEVMGAVHYRPAVSVILPFDPQKDAYSKLAYSLKVALHQVEDELMENFPADTALVVIRKLRKQMQEVNFKSPKKSVAFYASPVFEKTLYLDVPVEEKIIVDESFEIRDLVYSRKQLHKYLVLLLTGKESRIFLGNGHTLMRLIPDNPETIYAYVNEVPERVANFSDMNERKEILMEKFLHQVDKGLEGILRHHPLPLFVMGTERLLGHFNKITRHQAAVVEYIRGNYLGYSNGALSEVLQPAIRQWQQAREQELLGQLDAARSRQRMVGGMLPVWHEAMQGNGRLLVIEKNFMFPAQRVTGDAGIEALTPPVNELSYIRDAVDDVIEKVLQHGGDVEFVSEGLLEDAGHIALIQHY